jgi:hypothetical protein
LALAIVFNSRSLIPIRVVDTKAYTELDAAAGLTPADVDAQPEHPLDPSHVGPGESFLLLDRSRLEHLALVQPVHLDGLREHVAAHHGIDPPSIPSNRCAVVHRESGAVLSVVMADPLTDEHPDGVLVRSDVAREGWTWADGKFSGPVDPERVVGTAGTMKL